MRNEFIILIVFVLFLPFPGAMRDSYQLILQITGIVSILYFLLLLFSGDRIWRFSLGGLDFPVLIAFALFPVCWFLLGVVKNSTKFAFVDLFKFSCVFVIYMLSKHSFIHKKYIFKFERFVVKISLLYVMLLICWLGWNLTRGNPMGYFRRVVVPASIMSLSLSYIFIFSSSKISLGLKWGFFFLLPIVCVMTLGRLMFVMSLSYSLLWLTGKKVWRSRYWRNLLFGTMVLVPFVFGFYLYSQNQLKQKDLSLWWRRYEWQFAISHFRGESFPVQFLGEGFGFYIEPETPLISADAKEYDVIPNFHNLWLFLVLKTGIFGILVMLWVTARVWKFAGYFVSSNLTGSFLVFAVLFDFFVVGTVGGLFSQSYSFPFLVGLKMGVLEGFRVGSVKCAS